MQRTQTDTRERERCAGKTDRRAVSHVLGVVLVVAVVLAGVVSIVGFGIAGVTDSTAELSDTAVERDLTGIANAIDSATVEGDSAAGTTAVELSTGGLAESRDRVAVDETAGRLTAALRANGTERELANTSLGVLEYENPESSTRLAYQSGLVFSAPDRGATPAVVRANAFDHRTDRGVTSLTLPVISLQGQTRLDRRLVVTAGAARDRYPGVLVDTGDADALVLRVESAYSAGWELALREVLPPERTTVSRTGTGIEVVYDVPPAGLFLHLYRHDVRLGGR